MFDLSLLNLQQRQAVRKINGPVLILAGAGSGKTRTITARIAHMIDEGIPPEQILSVTFTNKAATEMRERVSTMISKKAGRALTIGTFHSFCVKMLREDIERLGYKKNFVIYSQSDQLSLLRKIITRISAREEKLEAEAALSLISAARNKEGALAGEPDSLVRAVHLAYQADLKSFNAVDFDDLLILGVRLLHENPDVRDKFRDRHRYVMVDEFQDTNSLQLSLMKEIAGQHQNICVVGDDDQSIYGWRGADITNILGFEKHFAHPTVIKLEENYRMTNSILKLANSLIRHNLNRREKNLWSQNGDGEVVRLIGMEEDTKEPDFIANEIFRINAVEKTEWEQFAILFRTNTQSRLLEMKFRSMKIPYRVVGTMSFFDRREVKEISAYLSILVNPADDISLLRIINAPTRGIGNTTMDQATEFSISHKCSVWDAIQDGEFLAQCSSRAKEALTGFVTLILEYRDAALLPSTNLGAMLERLLAQLKYMDYVKKSCKEEEERESREKVVKEVVQAIYAFEARRGGKGLESFLDDWILRADREDDEQDISEKKGVCLITLHASKGLEFPIVYLVGLEEGILPHKRSVEEGTRDEERRLLYVGITRAMKRLTLSYSLNRRRYGDLVTCMPSSFIREMDPNLLQHLKQRDLDNRQVQPDEAKATFAQMRAMLAEKNKSMAS